MKTVFLKLGGSLVTDKNKPFTAKLEIIRSIGQQLRIAIELLSDIQLVIGHGSGSFGHAAAKAAGYMEGDASSFAPHGFQSIWHAAQRLNRIILDEFTQIGLPVISFPPSASIRSETKKIVSWEITPILSALSHHLIPIIYGDTVFDHNLGGVIYSTEELFLHLAEVLRPESILLAGKEPGVWADFPRKVKIIPELSKDNFSGFQPSINASQSVDVTGGMLKKVQLMLQIKRFLPASEIRIFSGEAPDAVLHCLSGEKMGTAII
jgi:isopentenyl phosphate kinase